MAEQTEIHEIFGLFEKFGHENYIGEKVSQLQHAQQCAQEAKRAGYSDHVVLGTS